MNLRKITTLLLVAIIMMTVSTSFIFADEPSFWAEIEVKKAIQENLVPKHMQNNYKNSITRGEFCLLFSSYLKSKFNEDVFENKALLDSLIKVNKFKDIDTSGKIGKSVLIAKSKGIIEGRDDYTFDPNGYITREEAAKILANSLNYTKNINDSGIQSNIIVPNTHHYNDGSVISNWADYGVSVCSDYKIMNGISGNIFNPKGFYTREQSYLTFLRLSIASNYISNPQDIPDISNSNGDEKPSDGKQNSDNDKTSVNQIKQRVLDLVNIERQKAGLSPLKQGDSYSDYADVRALEIIELFDHVRPDGTGALASLSNIRFAGENIAAGYSTPEEVVEGWMNSSGHRENILNKNFEYLSVGFAEGGKYGKNWVQIFYTPHK